MSEHGERGSAMVAIVGRPNVGKSTLMNRLLGRREAIVEERPGVTRDRKTVEVEWQGVPFLLVDTGGWSTSGDDLDGKVSRQSERAMAEADVVLVVVDGVVGPTDEDAAVADLARRRGVTALAVVNKIDHASRQSDAWAFLTLGIGDPYAISALHGHGTGDLLDAVVAALPGDTSPPGSSGDVDGDSTKLGSDVADDSQTVAVALVGRPNAGKSTLFNRLIGDDRSVVHDQPGTTRDVIDTVVETALGRIRFVDTAGMRRRSRVDDGTEYYSVVRALRAVDAADVALLVVDAEEGVTAQDQRLAERIAAAGCPVIVLLNKWEVVPDERRRRVEREVGRRLHFVGDAPVLKISALTGSGANRLLPALAETIDAYHTRVPTRAVNDVLRRAQAAQPAPDGARVLYATQGATDPPTFTLFANRRLPQTYLRYLERSLREAFDLGRTPLRVRVRVGKG